MRYKRLLSQRQIEFILSNPDLSNYELAKRMNSTPNTIATYKRRMRKRGMEIPKYKYPKRSEISLRKILIAIRKEKENPT